MTRARHAIGALAWGAMVALTLVWWAPSFLLLLARWWGGRLRFEAVMGLGRVLVAAGLPEAARWVYAAEIRRAERQMRVMVRRRGW